MKCDTLFENKCSELIAMTESVVELSRETAEKVDRILWLLEGDELRPGLISLVEDHTFVKITLFPCSGQG